MVDPNAVKFISSLVKSLQMVCHGFMEFSDNIEIIGHINLRIDNRQKFDYIVNEQVSKQGGESTVFLSNSYHSLPPPKCNGGERERSFSSKFEEDGNVNNHHRLDESVAAMGGSRVQVDLSGPVPVTRSTSAPSHDGFFSTAGNNHRRSQSRDSRLHSAEEEQTAATAQEDHSFNHSSSAPSKDREQMDREEVGLAGSRGGGGERSEHNSVMSMYKETDIARQQSLGHRQDVIIKPEPNELFNSAMDESGGGLARDSDVLDASSTSSVLPAAHQSATVLATAAHTGHTMLAATTLGHPGFFDASLTSQDGGDTGRHSLVQQALMQQIIHAQKHAQHLALPGARFSAPGGLALAGATAAATTFGSVGMGFGGMGGPFPPPYPLAFHHLAQTYMHAVWRQGLYHHHSSSSSSSSSAPSPNAAATSATVSLQAWNTTGPSQPAGTLSAIRSGSTGGGVSGGDKGKRTLTPAQRMREYREKLKRNPEVYQRYKQMNALRSRLARMRRTQEQIERDREKARQRNLKNRGPSPRLPGELDLMSLTSDDSALDFSLAGPVTAPPTHLLHEPPARLPYLLQDTFHLPPSLHDNVCLPQASEGDSDMVVMPDDSAGAALPPDAPDAATPSSTEDAQLLHFPSCSTEDWEPSVTFEDSTGST
ncbi:uncharacterized protein LOC143296799 isoform X2 [Babylonia areolata]|uniref:uncharacterized protein LOC143296799 isoform X2 n=1 Tax=Babylonia areolata TaxID=304850 RepID=UPI003FD5623C